MTVTYPRAQNWWGSSGYLLLGKRLSQSWWLKRATFSLVCFAKICCLFFISNHFAHEGFSPVSLGDGLTPCAIAWGPLVVSGWLLGRAGGSMEASLIRLVYLWAPLDPLPDPGVSLCGLSTLGRCTPDVAAEGSRMSVPEGRAGNF